MCLAVKSQTSCKNIYHIFYQTRYPSNIIIRIIVLGRHIKWIFLKNSNSIKLWGRIKPIFKAIGQELITPMQLSM